MTTGERAQAARPCLTCVAVSLLLVAAVVASFVGLGIDFGAMLSADALRLMVKFVAEFLHPDLSAQFVAKTAWATLQTLAVSALGTLFAIVGGALAEVAAAGAWRRPQQHRGDRLGPLSRGSSGLRRRGRLPTVTAQV